MVLRDKDKEAKEALRLSWYAAIGIDEPGYSFGQDGIEETLVNQLTNTAGGKDGLTPRNTVNLIMQERSGYGSAIAGFVADSVSPSWTPMPDMLGLEGFGVTTPLPLRPEGFLGTLGQEIQKDFEWRMGKQGNKLTPESAMALAIRDQMAALHLTTVGRESLSGSQLFNGEMPAFIGDQNNNGQHTLEVNGEHVPYYLGEMIESELVAMGRRTGLLGNTQEILDEMTGGLPLNFRPVEGKPDVYRLAQFTPQGYSEWMGKGEGYAEIDFSDPSKLEHFRKVDFHQKLGSPNFSDSAQVLSENRTIPGVEHTQKAAADFFMMIAIPALTQVHGERGQAVEFGPGLPWSPMSGGEAGRTGDVTTGLFLDAEGTKAFYMDRSGGKNPWNFDVNSSGRYAPGVRGVFELEEAVEMRIPGAGPLIKAAGWAIRKLLGKPIGRQEIRVRRGLRQARAGVGSAAAAKWQQARDVTRAFWNSAAGKQAEKLVGLAGKGLKGTWNGRAWIGAAAFLTYSWDKGMQTGPITAARIRQMLEEDPDSPMVQYAMLGPLVPLDAQLRERLITDAMRRPEAVKAFLEVLGPPEKDDPESFAKVAQQHLHFDKGLISVAREAAEKQHEGENFLEGLFGDSLDDKTMKRVVQELTAAFNLPTHRNQTSYDTRRLENLEDLLSEDDETRATADMVWVVAEDIFLGMEKEGRSPTLPIGHFPAQTGDYQEEFYKRLMADPRVQKLSAADIFHATLLGARTQTVGEIRKHIPGLTWGDVQEEVKKRRGQK